MKPIHDCPDCHCGMYRLTWSDRESWVHPSDYDAIAEVVVGCALDGERTPTGVPWGLPDKTALRREPPWKVRE